MGTDAYSDLAGALSARKRAYLCSLADPNIDHQPAYSRGYLKVPNNRVDGGSGKRPTATPAEIADANNKRKNDLVFWEDTPALRVGVPNALEDDDVNMVVARLTAADLTATETTPLLFSPTAIVAFTPPQLNDVVHGRILLALSFVIGVRLGTDGTVVQDWLRDSVLNASNLFKDDGLRNRIRTSFDNPPPQGTGPEPSPVTVQFLTKFTVDGEDDRLQSGRAAVLMLGIAAFLHSDQDRNLYYDFEENLIVYLEYLLGDDDTPTLPKETWTALDWLSWLGRCNEEYFASRWMHFGQRLPRAANVSTDESQFAKAESNPFIIPYLLVCPNTPLPEKWVWPEFSAEGIYWWRAIILRHCITHILSFQDTSDFHITDLLRFSRLFALFSKQPDARIPAYVIAAVKQTFLNFKYWFDEAAESDRNAELSGTFDTEMTFWSENHQIQFYQGQVLVGSLFPHETFAHASLGKDTPVTGADLKQAGEDRLRRWLDHRLQFGFSEWNAPGYYNEDLPPLFNVADYCDIPELQTKAAMVLDRLIFDLARYTCRGSFGVTAGRAYFEHKCYGWEQSVGNTVEVLFGTRGDITGEENTATALATTNYEVPPVLLAIGIDRREQDRQEPFTDRSRISINLDEAGDYGIGFSEEKDVVSWWGKGAYFTDQTLEGTRKIAEAHDNLTKTNPFKILYPDPNLPWYAALVTVILDLAKTPIVGDVVETGAGAALATTASQGLLLPAPLNIIAGALTLIGIELEISGIVQFVGDLIKTGVRAIEKLFGGGDDNQPTVPESSVISFLEKLLITFNKGSALTRVNQLTYTNGDAMLSSIQSHMPGEIAFQKHPWQATLDCEACVWTTAPMSNTVSFWDRLPLTNLHIWLEFLKDLGSFKPLTALTSLAAPEIPGIFGHDGPNYWTGTFALPMVVQHQNAAIIAYNLPNLQRAMTATQTHAWFPKNMFDETDLRDKDDGTWVFGRKGSGYVALYSARQVRFTSDGDFKDKELLADGSSNVWVCVVGNTTAFGTSVAPLDKWDYQALSDPAAADRRGFQNFINQVYNAYLHVSGLGSVNQVECSFDIPGAQAPPGRSPRLELFYSDNKGRFAGGDLGLDNYPKFENKYVQADWGATSYTIRHPQTNLSLLHDLKQPNRVFDRPAAPAPSPNTAQDPFKRKPFTPFRQTIKLAKKLALQ